MCNYCGCRSIATLARLTEDHEQLLNARGELGRAVDRGDLQAAVERLHALVETLQPHDAIEELALYPALLAVDGYADSVGHMFDEHDDVDAVLQRAVAAAAEGPDAVEWGDVQAATQVLARHIDAEEHGLFPAAAVSLDSSVWDYAETIARERIGRHAA